MSEDWASDKNDIDVLIISHLLSNKYFHGDYDHKTVIIFLVKC